tara:strand:+ start:2234 stop:2458 length:225 start_codon:yes stop_codon:yes gene_type:complete
MANRLYQTSGLFRRVVDGMLGEVVDLVPAQDCVEVVKQTLGRVVLIFVVAEVVAALWLVAKTPERGLIAPIGKN